MQVNTHEKLCVGGRVSMLPSRGMNDSSCVAKLQGGWQQFGKKYFPVSLMSQKLGCVEEVTGNSNSLQYIFAIGASKDM